jgi:transcriptional regulator with XRE-family HTH domain
MKTNDAEKQALGKRLRKLREYQGYTQEAVAQALGLMRPSVSMIEEGRRNLTALELSRLSRLYSLPVAYLLDEPADVPRGGSETLQALAGLPEEDRAEVLRFAEFLRFRKAKLDERPESV